MDEVPREIPAMGAVASPDVHVTLQGCHSLELVVRTEKETAVVVSLEETA